MQKNSENYLLLLYQVWSQTDEKIQTIIILEYLKNLKHCINEPQQNKKCQQRHLLSKVLLQILSQAFILKQLKKVVKLLLCALFICLNRYRRIINFQSLSKIPRLTNFLLSNADWSLKSISKDQFFSSIYILTFFCVIIFLHSKMKKQILLQKHRSKTSYPEEQHKMRNLPPVKASRLQLLKQYTKNLSQQSSNSIVSIMKKNISSHSTKREKSNFNGEVQHQQQKEEQKMPMIHDLFEKMSKYVPIQQSNFLQSCMLKCSAEEITLKTQDFLHFYSSICSQKQNLKNQAEKTKEILGKTILKERQIQNIETSINNILSKLSVAEVSDNFYSLKYNNNWEVKQFLFHIIQCIEKKISKLSQSFLSLKIESSEIIRKKDYLNNEFKSLVDKLEAKQEQLVEKTRKMLQFKNDKLMIQSKLRMIEKDRKAQLHSTELQEANNKERKQIERLSGRIFEEINDIQLINTEKKQFLSHLFRKVHYSFMQININFENLISDLQQQIQLMEKQIADQQKVQKYRLTKMQSIKELMAKLQGLEKKIWEYDEDSQECEIHLPIRETREIPILLHQIYERVNLFHKTLKIYKI